VVVLVRAVAPENAEPSADLNICIEVLFPPPTPLCRRYTEILFKDDAVTMKAASEFGADDESADTTNELK
jgi:hypothetical protein